MAYLGSDPDVGKLGGLPGPGQKGGPKMNKKTPKRQKLQLQKKILILHLYGTGNVIENELKTKDEFKDIHTTDVMKAFATKSVCEMLQSSEGGPILKVCPQPPGV